MDRWLPTPYRVDYCIQHYMYIQSKGLNMFFILTNRCLYTKQQQQQTKQTKTEQTVTDCLVVFFKYFEH